MEDDLELSAVWGSSLPVSSQVLRFQAMLFEEMGDDLELFAVWGSSLPVSSQVLNFQAMLFEEMGDNLEDVSNVEIQIGNHLSSVRTKVTRGGTCNL